MENRYREVPSPTSVDLDVGDSFYCVSEALEVDERIDYEGLARYDG